MGRGRNGVLVQSKQKADPNAKKAYAVIERRPPQGRQVLISGAVMEKLKNMDPELLTTLLLKSA